MASWLVSDEGGLRMGRNLGKFLAILAGFWLLNLLLSRLASKTMALASGASQILVRFVVNTVRRVTIIVGLILGLAALELNITLLVVPNNELWGKVITNVTGSSERRVDLVFGIGYADNIATAERVLHEVVSAHPAVLVNPSQSSRCRSWPIPRST